MSPEVQPSVFLASFTPINREPSSFKPAPKVVRRHSGAFGSVDNLPGATGSYNVKSKRRKTESASRHAKPTKETTTTGQIPSSLLLSPPAKTSRKKGTTRRKSAPSHQSEPFPEAPIVKPSKKPKQKKSDVQFKTVNYQGFTTTEESLKNTVKLAKTTLDKLASFMHKPELLNDQVEVRSPNVDTTGSVDLQSPIFMDDEHEVYVPLSASQIMLLDEEDAQVLNVAHFEDAYFEDLAPMLDDSYREEPQTHPELSGNDSSEFLEKQLDIQSYTDNARPDEDQDSASPGNQDLEHPRDDTLSACDATSDVLSRSCVNPSHLDADELDLLPTSAPSSQSNVDNVTRSPQHQFVDRSKLRTLTLDANTNLINPVGSSSVSSNHQIDMVGTQASNSYSEYHNDVDFDALEFADGDMGDEDLCALGLIDEGKQEGDANAVNHFVIDENYKAPSQELCGSNSEQLTSRDSLLHVDADRSIPNHRVPPQSVNYDDPADSEDEFPIDEADEEALMQLNLPFGTTQETQPPPSSIPFISEADSRDLEVYDRTLQYSDPSGTKFENRNDLRDDELNHPANKILLEENWAFLKDQNTKGKTIPLVSNRLANSVPLLPHNTARNRHGGHISPTKPANSQAASQSAAYDDSEEYLPLKPFARPEFPKPMLDRSPVIGFSGSLVLRTCFRIGEAFRIAAVSDNANYEIILELYARVTFSSREEGTLKQHFQFADLFHDRPPFLNGILENYKISDLANTESKQLLGESNAGQLVRCLGKMRREFRGKRLLAIDNVRKTDWEEIGRTKRIIEDLSGKVKPEGGAGSGYFNVR